MKKTIIASFLSLYTSCTVYYMLSCSPVEDKHFRHSVGKVKYAYPKMILSYLPFKSTLRKLGTEMGAGARMEKGIAEWNALLVFFVLGVCRANWHDPHNYPLHIQQSVTLQSIIL